MKNYIQNFIQNEDGAVTVDWVVLTAAIVGLATVGVQQTRLGVSKAASTISSDLAKTTTGVE
ncbi:hypothetical protein PEL8287_02032 [Roseovarius litorisediminis]|uniref:Uncharacterized protein n=1 Tax=Roseovarius litorisediminis TaxID=1312363 RepID=A0A1Y5SK57_9RHOB|nr:hypothetical protein [Roseovarius litorisediminis]SLN40960.1 hypothetical protein PEL8287_02032 [Roseovarius litorisediminis]